MRHHVGLWWVGTVASARGYLGPYRCRRLPVVWSIAALYTAPKRGCGQGRGPLMSSAGRSGRHDRRPPQRLVWPARRRTASPPATFAGIGRTGACAATVIEVPARRSAALPFAAVGAACIVAGGLVAAVSAPAPSEHASWAAAYLVLVVGAAQAALGVGQALLALRVPSRRNVAVQFTAWNLGNAAVLTGTLAGITTLVDTGGALLVVALLLLRGVRTGREPRTWLLWAFRLLAAVLLISIPIGLVLARTRPGG